uniref:Uncharacterized protein n=1 Tax=Brassica oleracea TaxID=3712 RepID=A0A3P6B550_BRAOL|nr:unnamed protein product [Brassica oleracea]
MPSSTRSNKEKQLLFSDPARLERSIRKEVRTASIDINACSLTDTRIPAMETCMTWKVICVMQQVKR